jgi:serine/threonine-protein kinase
MGVIYRATDTTLGREVAVKVLLDTFASDSGTARRFDGEARITAQLQHPAIPPVHDCGNLPDGRPFLAMKLIKGRTLEELLRECSDTVADRARFLAVFEQVCQALAYAHAHEVIHRDLKPANVMVGAFGEVQVMDWGLAKVLTEAAVPATGHGDLGETLAETRIRGSDDGGSNGLYTRAGSILGTLAYMPPEQAAGEVGTVDPRSDVFGLGAMLAAILTGQPPYIGTDAEAVRVMAIRGDVAACLARLDHCGAELELVELCKHCLAFKPTDRPRDAGAVAARLTAYLSGVQERLRSTELARATESARAEEAQRTAVAAQARAAAERRAGRLFVALAVLLFITAGLVVAGWRWVEVERLGRAREATAKVTDAIQEATRLRGQAQGAAVGDLAPWNLAVAAAEKTHDLLTEGVEPGLRKQVENLFADLVAGRERAHAAANVAEQDRLLVENLVDIRTAKVDDLTGIGTDAAYAKAFRDAGIDPETMTPQRCATAIESRSSSTAEAITQALDDWAVVRRGDRLDASGAKRPAAVARLADPDPWRSKLRDALEISDKPSRQRALIALAASIKDQSLPPVSVDLLGRALLDVGANAEAESILRKGRRLSPNDLWLNYDLGVALQSLGRREEAIRYFTAARILNPLSAHELAHALESRGESDEAIGVFRDLARLRPGNGRHLSCLGSALQDYGRKQEARVVLTSAVRTLRDTVAARPDDYVAILNLGNALKNLGQLDEAIAMYRKAIKINPNYVTALENLGISLFLQDKYDEALVSYKDALRLDPKTVVANQGLGSVLEAKGRVDEAIAAYRRAVNARPDDGFTHNRLGALLAKKGRWEEALIEGQESVRLNPNNSDIQQGFGQTLQGLGRFEEAATAFRKSIDLNPNNSYPLNSLAWLLLTAPDRRQRRPEEALLLSRRAVEEGANVATNFNTLGLAEFRNGLWDNAIATLKKSIEMDKGTDPTDFFFLAMAHHRRGNKAEAEKSFQQGIAGAKKDAPNQWDWRMLWAEAAELLGKPGPVPTLFEVKAEPDRATATLRRMASAGFLQPEILKTSPDLAPLRDLPDFRLLLKELTKEPQPSLKQ